jgi:flagellar motor switch protein FliM
MQKEAQILLSYTSGLRKSRVMEKTLKQDEIDALFQAARSSAPETATHSDLRSQIAPYSFASAGQISTDQLRAISMLNDLFARNLTHSLSAWLRTRLQVNLVSAEQITFSDFLLRIPEISYVSSVRLEPLGALSVLQLDLSIAPAVIDLLLGGEGQAAALRELTDIEESIVGSVVEIVCRELTTAWQPVGLSFNFERRQMQTQVARIMPVTEKTLCLSFEVRMGESSGLLNLAFPAVVANTILRRLTGEWGGRRRHADESRIRIERSASHLRFGAALQLPSVRIEARELEDLAVGKLIRLNLAANVGAELRAGGQLLFHAQPVRLGPHRGARLEAAVDAPVDLSSMSDTRLKNTNSNCKLYRNDWLPETEEVIGAKV